MLEVLNRLDVMVTEVSLAIKTAKEEDDPEAYAALAAMLSHLVAKADFIIDRLMEPIGKVQPAYTNYDPDILG